MDAKVALTALIEHESQAPGYWDDNRRATARQSQMTKAKRDLETWAGLAGADEEMSAHLELLEGTEDAGLEKELAQCLERLEKVLAALDFNRMLSGPYDRNSALLTIRPGAGGTESQDWAQMLLRMYTRWAERKGYDVSLLDLQPGEEAGIKDATLRIAGDWAFGLLRSEKGVHRLVRISPFDSNARRHTSFASVEPFPEIDDSIVVVIEDKDLRIDVFRASGAGGQHVNRTESAVRITHLPSGIVVTCQNDRSQVKNKASAMGVLKARLFVRAEEAQREKVAGIAGVKRDINFGSQVRSYVLHPYQQVKDLRSGYETSQSQAVLDGEIEPLIESFLRHESLEAVKADG